MFYIGPHLIDPPFLLAPMAGVSEMPFRVIALEFGAGLATTELISAKGLFHRSKRTEQYLAFNEKIERPYSLQLFGGEEATMAQAAVIAVEAGAQIIDVNMGCPVKKVTQTGAGSALLCDPKRAASLIAAMRKSVQDFVPITAKIRTGWDEHHINCIEMGKVLQDAGCAALAMHARSRAQGYSGKANWDLIGELRSALQIPVIGNGDVTNADDAYLMQKQTGCDGVMIGRGAMGNPWIFQELKTGQKSPPSLQERKNLVLRHLREHINFHTQLDESRIDVQQRAVRSFRTHLVWYSRGLKDASYFRERVMHLETLISVEQALHDFFDTTYVDVRKSLPETELDEIDYRQAFG
jgi:tRNA-dihydrouridine synthase B